MLPFSGLYHRFIESDINLMRKLSLMFNFDDLSWMVDSNEQYVHNLIHEIDELTDYLNYSPVIQEERERLRKIIEDYSRRDVSFENMLNEYIHWVELERMASLTAVDIQCHEIITRYFNNNIGKNDLEQFLSFWKAYVILNDKDNAQAMYLTSGRWDINVILPILRVIVYCLIEPKLGGDKSSTTSYKLARFLIAPHTIRLTLDEETMSHELVGDLYDLLRLFDRQTMFSFSIAGSQLQNYKPDSLKTLLLDYLENPDLFSPLENIGMYPPFCWNEIQSINQYSKAKELSREKVCFDLLNKTTTTLRPLLQSALNRAFQIKQLEFEYYAFNYKGFFTFVSRYFYQITSKFIDNPSEKQLFLDHILGDRFLYAYDVLEKNIQLKGNSKT